MGAGRGHFPPPESDGVRRTEPTPLTNLPTHVPQPNHNPFDSSSWPTPHDASRQIRRSSQAVREQSAVNDRTNTKINGPNNYGRSNDFHFSGRPNPRSTRSDNRFEGHRVPISSERHSAARNFQSSGGYYDRGSHAPTNPYSVASYIQKSLEERQARSDRSRLTERSRNPVDKSSFNQPSRGIGVGLKAPADQFGYFSALSGFGEIEIY